ncbi:MAG: aminotransferase class I/II-fold pyridoxal phosphate-dependent enzyme [Clostridia bacterium]|nr:aminotransferase class I/II-fold pyridoxal phosphate-dependent enzyme [Clostridia bacterium]MBQ5800480.1 aminotransferase class I/II-fold pyridoxal phosphate-dependent enzyme [Clostridia bacterium]
MSYFSKSKKELEMLEKELLNEYNSYKAMGLSLDLSRGKPCTEQLDLSMGMFSSLDDESSYIAEDGFDCRNYGLTYGLPEAKRFFSDLTGVPTENIIVGGNSSLNLMYDAIARAMLYGVVGSIRPWCKEEKLKFLCPAPGYDRHFAVTESLGFELITVNMTENGPDMDEVEALVKNDAQIKGIWCVPKYSNPTGITYSDETVERLVKMHTAAPDFRIFFDNAYAIHDMCEEGDKLADVFALAKKYGNENRVFYFTSTSKVTLPGAGISMFAASKENLEQIKPIMAIQTIGPDKLNQLRHIRFLENKEAVFALMKKHGAIIGEKFKILLDTLNSELGGLGIAEWTSPRGGYFTSLDVLDGCAKAVYELCREAGVTLTKVGATFPYGVDARDRNLRLAPTYAKNEDLALAAKVLTCATKLACVRKILSEK